MGSFYEPGIMGFSPYENKRITLFTVQIKCRLKIYSVNQSIEFNDHFDKSKGEPYNPLYNYKILFINFYPPNIGYLLL